jgi:hypothetical protein
MIDDKFAIKVQQQHDKVHNKFQQTNKQSIEIRRSTYH